MKWKEKTIQEVHQERRAYLKGWHRVFAWVKIKDENTRMFYRWQFVWRRCIKFQDEDRNRHEDSFYPSHCTPAAWEVREGPKDAPEFVQRPVSMKETSV